MEQRNLDKIKPFIEMYNNGEIIYKDGALYRTTKRYNQHKTVELETPELMRFDSPRGYWRVSNKGVTCYEHVVIYALLHGLDSLKEFECIDHVDDNKKNNRIENLEGVSVEENNVRAKNNGLIVGIKGKDNSMSKLSDEDVLKIRKFYTQNKYNQKELAKMYDISQSHVSDIVNYKRWSHLN